MFKNVIFSSNVCSLPNRVLRTITSIHVFSLLYLNCIYNYICNNMYTLIHDPLAWARAQMAWAVVPPMFTTVRQNVRLMCNPNKRESKQVELNFFDNDNR